MTLVVGTSFILNCHFRLSQEQLSLLGFLVVCLIESLYIWNRDVHRAQNLYLYLYLLRQQNYLYLYLYSNKSGNRCKKYSFCFYYTLKVYEGGPLH